MIYDDHKREPIRPVLCSNRRSCGRRWSIRFASSTRVTRSRIR